MSDNHPFHSVGLILMIGKILGIIGIIILMIVGLRFWFNVIAG